MNRITFLILIIFSLPLTEISTYAQTNAGVNIEIDGNISLLPVYSKREMNYVPASDFAKKLGAGYYFNPTNEKAEIKFKKFTYKFTGKNQFVIISEKERNKVHVLQMPVSALLYHQDIYLPVNYIAEIFNTFPEFSFDFNSDNNTLAVKTVSSSPSISESEEKKPANEITVGIPSIPKSSTFDVFGLRIDEKTNGTLIRMSSNRMVGKIRSSINNNKCLVFLHGVTVDPQITKSAKPAGLVKNIKKTNIGGGVQLEFDLREGYSNHEAFQDPSSGEIMITIRTRIFEQPSPGTDIIKEKWVFDAVVIDAGHGGKDAGAIGITRVKEKDVNLAIALKLGALINKEMPGVKVIYTRDNDEFVEIYKRGKIANEANGKLFISIHANSVRNKKRDPRGFEVYLLRPGRTEEAISIAEFENSVIALEENPDIYKELTDENFILVSMAHSSYMRFSEKFSDLLNSKWSSNIKEIPSRGVKQAGFFVLVGASMPGVLIETGFLSNPEDEKYISSAKGQKEIAATIFQSLKEYKDYYDRAFVFPE
ncbi:MAG: N-acetylmuramoyl-L-alanine amidase [Ignavibacteriales bacterium]|nr:N-acetylmuramoyl-L-alanine amidase [Ignavibacteriales bacterium]MCF8305653.1 N-acetylmuramoyl-L-alanine amidase [Ignavibacteriales bacterium]MCF8315375.1 N-acetylmuramoyl-L-alanine amidase [Ignavibacteriales bacterium]MCF8436733.1 N-acetylmuramoyl-L-alanine amidase [Ignavibacteriales bacterium]